MWYSSFKAAKQFHSEYWKETPQLTVPRSLNPMYWTLFMQQEFKNSKFYKVRGYQHFCHLESLQFLKATFSLNITLMEPKISPFTECH